MKQAGATGAPTLAVLGRHPGRATGAASSAAGFGRSAAVAPCAAPAASPRSSDSAPGASPAPSASASAMTCARRSAQTHRLRAAAAAGATEARVRLLLYTNLNLARHARARARLIGKRLPAGHGAHGCAAGERGPVGGDVLNMRLALSSGQACRVRRPRQLGARLAAHHCHRGIDRFRAGSAAHAREGGSRPEIWTAAARGCSAAPAGAHRAGGSLRDRTQLHTYLQRQAHAHRADLPPKGSPGLAGQAALCIKHGCSIIHMQRYAATLSAAARPSARPARHPCGWRAPAAPAAAAAAAAAARTPRRGPAARGRQAPARLVGRIAAVRGAQVHERGGHGRSRRRQPRRRQLCQHALLARPAQRLKTCSVAAGRPELGCGGLVCQMLSAGTVRNSGS